jgi:hypothetical protein
MAKKKKHQKKKRNKQLAGQTAVASAGQEKQAAKAENKTQPQNLKPATVAVAEAGSAEEANFVKQDVRYSLVVVGVIVAAFIVLYFLLQNPTVSKTVYGFIKLPNIGL